MTSSECSSIYKCGQRIIGETGREYVVSKAISAGGYGSVFKVKAAIDGQRFAMKVELRDKNRDHYKLMMEERILGEAKKKHLKHMPTLIDRKQDKKQMLIIMTLLGNSLAGVIRDRRRVLSLNTGFYCAVECLEAIKDLHEMGYIHRDIKPANFVLGQPGTQHQNVVYMVDFGIARKIVDESGSIHTPRAHVKFKGTVRFAPLACHQRKELGRKDDIEAWIWSVADMIKEERLPWHRLNETSEVQKMKEQAMANPSQLFSGDMREFAEILEYLKRQHYVDQLDYDWIKNLVLRVAKRTGCTLDPPYDWNKSRVQTLQTMQTG